MPTKQGGRALKNASTSDRCSFRSNIALPAPSTPCSWKTRLAMSKPIVVISMVDGSFCSLHLTARAWHIAAVRGSSTASCMDDPVGDIGRIARPHLGADRPAGAVHHQTEDHLQAASP